jgi:2-polyprenyl-3-methyl-5-hydroxy-6-metoxy-1,4-benzoquinol methylase
MKLDDYLYEVAMFAFEHGEILKARQLLESRPLIIHESEKINQLLDRINERLDKISYFQTNGRLNSGFSDPPDVHSKTCYVRLKDKLNSIGTVRSLIDVGCFSGWVGRNLSLWGYKVHGIDIDPYTMRCATLSATGTRATYEVLEATKVGEKYPKKFDGAIMFDVVEHVFDDRIILQSVENSVKDGGYVFINLPKYDEKLDGRVSPDHVKEHLRSYNDDTMRKLFGKKKEFEYEIIYEEGSDCDYIHDEIPSYFITYRV